MQTAARPARLGHFLGRIVVLAILGIGALVMTTPFYWLLSSSLKEPQKIWLFPPQWIPDPIRWENYLEALTASPFHLYLFNTLVIVIAGGIGVLLTASMAAYGFARLRFRGRDFMFTVILSTIMLPWVVTMIPRYIMFKELGWLDTPLPLIVPDWFGGGAFYIFLLRQFFRTIPRDFTDAARIDGASEFGIYWRVVLPLIKPALTAVAIFVFLNHWNDFLGPLIYLTSPEKYTISLGLASFKGLYTTQWHYLMASSTATILPVLALFFLAQRYFIQGIVMSGIKG
jgi:ABC-type glycerol-3-phosphate transport system permease component